jgi:Flp pilus assembly pilin Flp
MILLPAASVLKLFGRFVRRIANDESGQDLVEYGLMAAFIGIAGYLVLMALGGDILNTYQAWLNPTTGTPSLWDPPAPSGGS